MASDFDGLNNGGTYDDVFDTPYEGITVYLINSSGRQVAETTTDANGAYTFTNLAALTYTVSVNRNSAQLAGTTLTATPNPDPTKSYNTVVASAADQDFGFFASMDFGDLPDTYNITLLSDEGPYHRTGSLWLGSSISTEADGVESSAAISDTYDDGVALDLNDSWVAGADVNLVVTVTGGTGYLIGWLDWDGNNNFSDAGDEVRFGSLGVGVHTLTLTVPSGCCENETVNARFRLYDGRPLAISPTGAVTNGEVEDYQWEFGPTAVTVQGVDARSGMMLGASALLAVLAVAGLAALLLGRRFSRRPA